MISSLRKKPNIVIYVSLYCQHTELWCLTSVNLQRFNGEKTTSYRKYNKWA